MVVQIFLGTLIKVENFKADVLLDIKDDKKGEGVKGPNFIYISH